MLEKQLTSSLLDSYNRETLWRSDFDKAYDWRLASVTAGKRHVYVNVAARCTGLSVRKRLDRPTARPAQVRNESAADDPAPFTDTLSLDDKANLTVTGVFKPIDSFGSGH